MSTRHTDKKNSNLYATIRGQWKSARTNHTWNPGWLWFSLGVSGSLTVVRSHVAPLPIGEAEVKIHYPYCYRFDYFMHHASLATIRNRLKSPRNFGIKLFTRIRGKSWTFLESNENVNSSDRLLDCARGKRRKAEFHWRLISLWKTMQGRVGPVCIMAFWVRPRSLR